MAGIKSIEVSTAGSSYETLPTVTIASGFITQMKIDNPGTAYLLLHTNGTATASGSTTVDLDLTAVDCADDYFNNAAIYIVSGTGAGQLRTITDYTKTNRRATVSTWTTNPDTTSVYEIGPAISFSGGGGSSAAAAAIVRNGAIQQIIFTNRGTGYTTLPTVSVTGGDGDSGTGAIILPSIDVGAGATAVAKLTGTSIASAAVSAGALSRTGGTANAKYTKIPSIVVTPSNDDTPTTTAVLTPVLTSTGIARLTVTNGGSGYAGSITVTVAGAGTATATQSGGVINAIALTGAGSGYTDVPSVSIAGSGGGSGAVVSVSLVPTTIASVTVSTAGAGYTAPPTCKVVPQDKYGDQNGCGQSSPDGVIAESSGDPLDAGADGLGIAATITPTLTSTTLGSIQLTATGNGYATPPPITIAGGGGGTQATASSTLNKYDLKATQKAGQKGMKALKTTKSPDPNTPPGGGGIFGGGGGRVPQKLLVGRLAMLGTGLYRVVGADPISYGVFLGLQGEVTAHTAGATTFTIKLTENDTNLSGIAIPAGTPIVFGGEDAGAVREVGKTAAAATFSSGSQTFTLTGALTADGAFGVGTKVRFQFIPGNSGSSTNFLLNKFKVNDLETGKAGKNTIVVYHMGIGIGHTPKFIAANGAYAKAGRASLTAEVDITDGGGFEDGAKELGLGSARSDSAGVLPDNHAYAVTQTADVTTLGGQNQTFVGLTSPRVRVYQPAGVPKFTASDVGFRDNASDSADTTNDALMINKTGWLTANESPSYSPNPNFMLWIGTGESQLPEFQVAANDEDIIDPRLCLIGFKYALEPVPEKQAKRMLARSGGFRYEIIPHAQDAYSGQNLGSGTAGPAGPAGGWSTHVREHKGKNLNFEEWKQSTHQQTNQTSNILQGTSNRQANRKRDPRSAHRRDI